jgi:hypothetical protein
MGEIMPFYKRENDELLVAPNFVRGPGFDLFAEVHHEFQYPVHGWYWFETDDEASAALGAKPPQPVTDGGQPPNLI